jgi:hypothetical protein
MSASPGPQGWACWTCWARGCEWNGHSVRDTECRQLCKVECEENERILGAYAINLGGTFIFQSDNQANFRPQRQGVAIKVLLTCVPK